MLDEEKEAIEELKNKKADYFMISDLTGKTLLNLIEKQSKEIEHQIEKRANQRQELATLNAKQIEFNKLVNTVNSYKGQFKKQQKEIEELKNGQIDFWISDKEIEERIRNKFVSKDKIKAKIEEVDENGYWDFLEKRDVEKCKEVLQSLLEKE